MYRPRDRHNAIDQRGILGRYMTHEFESMSMTRHSFSIDLGTPRRFYERGTPVAARWQHGTTSQHETERRRTLMRDAGMQARPA